MVHFHVHASTSACTCRDNNQALDTLTATGALILHHVQHNSVRFLTFEGRVIPASVNVKLVSGNR